MEEQKTNGFKDWCKNAWAKTKNFVCKHKKGIAIGATAATALGLAYYKGKCDGKDEEIKLDLNVKLIPTTTEKVENEPTEEEEPAEETEEKPEKTYVMRFFDEETGEEYRPEEQHWRCSQEYVDDTMDSVPGT